VSPGTHLSPRSPVVIVGAGPAGLGAALALGRDALVLERSHAPGGLAATIHFAGAVFDVGGHSFHTPHPEVRDLVFGALEMYEQARDARCWCAGRLIDYPFQAHFDQLDDPAIVDTCRRGLEAARPDAGADDFESSLRDRFGNGIADYFLLPYNRKLWGGDLSRLAVDWTAERIAAPAGSDERFAESGGRRRPLRENTMVAYPACGGFERIFHALAERVPNIAFDQRVSAIDPIDRSLTTAGGTRVSWDRLVSTLPLPDLVARLTTRPAWMSEEAARLEALGLALVLVVVDRPIGTPVQRVYCADAGGPAHKYVLNHNSSPSLRALPRHGVLAEVSLGRAPDDVEARVVRALVQMRLLQSEGDVHATRVIRLRRAYPVPTRDRSAIVGRITEWLDAHGIHSIGRFGEWAYINADEALHRGLALGERVLGA
jgi:UDP-galactopyranose mutase